MRTSTYLAFIGLAMVEQVSAQNQDYSSDSYYSSQSTSCADDDATAVATAASLGVMVTDCAQLVATAVACDDGTYGDLVRSVCPLTCAQCPQNAGTALTESYGQPTQNDQQYLQPQPTQNDQTASKTNIFVYDGQTDAGVRLKNSGLKKWTFQSLPEKVDWSTINMCKEQVDYQNQVDSLDGSTYAWTGTKPGLEIFNGDCDTLQGCLDSTEKAFEWWAIESGYNCVEMFYDVTSGSAKSTAYAGGAPIALTTTGKDIFTKQCEVSQYQFQCSGFAVLATVSGALYQTIGLASITAATVLANM